MENELNVDGLSVATGVVETIVALAAAEVKGVAGIGSGASPMEMRSRAFHGTSHPTSSGVEVSVTSDGSLHITIRMQVFYGYRLGDIATSVREIVADAVLSQVGTSVEAIDILIDGIVFAE